MNVAPLFSVLYIVGYYLLLYGRTNNVVKRRAALCFAACQSKKVLPAWFASVDADICIGRRRCINRRVWHPCHTHAATPRSHIISRLRGGCVKSRKRYAPKGQKHIAQGSALG